MTIPYRLYFTLTIQHVQLNRIVQVTWAQPSTCLARLDHPCHMSSTLSCLAQLDCSGHMSSTLPACTAQLYPSSMLNSALSLQHAQLSSTRPACSNQLYPSSMFSSALPLQHAQLSSTRPARSTPRPACSTQLYPPTCSAQLNTSSVNTGLVVQVKPASSACLHLIPCVLYGRSMRHDSTRLVRMSCTLVHARPYRKQATNGRLWITI